MSENVFEAEDKVYLNQALELAMIRRGFCAPNPSVGAVIVKNNTILATGYHLGCGEPHAEVDALTKLGKDALGATAYVTLEPCCHWGRTPPCTDALIKAGINRVVFGYFDPNPLVSNKSASLLKLAGITCTHVSLPEIDKFYESYKYWHATQKPFVTGKIAITLNGKIAGKNGERIQLTGAALSEVTHSYRKNSDAILTTTKTIIQDNPKLNARNNDQIIPKILYILDSQLNIPLQATVFTTAKSITIFHSQNASKERLKILENQNVNCVAVEENQDGLNLNQVINLIGKDGIHDLWVEAGGKCFSALHKNNLLKRALIYIAPKILKEGLAAFESDLDFCSDQISWQQVGKDVLCEIRW